MSAPYGERGPYLNFACALCGRLRLLHDYPRRDEIECEKCGMTWEDEESAALAHREAGRREGRAEGAEIARLFSKFGRDKQSDSKLEDIRAGHVLSALSIAEHLDGLADGVRIHDACPGCDLIELFEAKMACERGSSGGG